MKKILVIDDEPQIAMLIKSRLSSNGYTVVTASDGAEGLKMLESELPDLIILDVMMPKMDGFTFVRALKGKQLDRRQPPVIVLTGKDKLKDLFELEGVVEYMTKPFKSEELIEKIQRHLG